MPEYDNNFTGIISRNDRKEAPNHADQTGTCTIDGVEYWVNGWIKERKDGSGKFLSLSFKKKEKQPDAIFSGSKETSSDDDFAF